MNDPILYKILRPFETFLFRLIYRPTYKGLENIPKNKSVVIAGNHTNPRDCLLLISSSKRCIHFMGKHTLFKGLKKIFFRQVGVIPVNRTIKDKNCLMEARKVLKLNEVIGIFPEGTINRTDEIIMPFKMGAVKLAYDTNSLILPFSITGKYIPFHKSITLEFGKPYELKDEDLELELHNLEKTITDLLIKNGVKK